MDRPSRTVHSGVSLLADAPFADLVERDLHGRTTEDELIDLRGADVVDRWHSVLVLTKTDIEAQLTRRSADLAATQQACLRRGEEGKAEYFAERARYMDWRARSIRVLQRVERRLVEVRRARREQHAQVDQQRALLARAYRLVPDTEEGRRWKEAYESIRE